MLSLVAHLKNLKTWQSFATLSDYTPVYRERKLGFFSYNYILKICEMECFLDIHSGNGYDKLEVDEVKSHVLNKEGKVEGIDLCCIIGSSGRLGVTILPHVNGLKHGTTKNFINGKLYHLSQYVNDLEEGYFITYYPDGNASRKEFYLNGKKEDQEISYYNNGDVRSVENYANDKLNGEAVVFYETGRMKSLRHFSNGKLDGKCLCFHRDGKISIDITYKDGEKIGIEYRYNEDGSISEEINYDNSDDDTEYYRHDEDYGGDS